MKSLNGREVADYMKNNQLHRVKSLISRKIQPKLVIIRDSKNPVIEKYVKLKKRYGKDIGVIVEDWYGTNLVELVKKANQDETVHGVIIQLPLESKVNLDELLGEIDAKKDVDGLGSYIIYDINKKGDDIKEKGHEIFFESATAVAINWLLAAYDINLSDKKIAIVGRGRLVGAPLIRMWVNSNYDVEVFHRGSDFSRLKNCDVIVSATGVPNLIKSEMVKAGAVLVDAGTASEGGVLVGDISDEVRERQDISAITPKIGGVGPLTVTALFEHVIIAADRQE